MSYWHELATPPPQAALTPFIGSHKGCTAMAQMQYRRHPV
jgi:hypothetical protein